MTSSIRNVLSGGRVRAVLFVAGALFFSSTARADSRADAKRHFREGMTLISAGQVERGIAELKQAYAIKPHPDVLYDIAKAYIDLGNIAEAVNYFRQYSATDPEDKEQVEKVITRLSATLGTPAAPAQQPGSLSVNGQPIDVQKLVAQLQMVVTQLQAQQVAAAAAAAAQVPPAVPAAARSPATSTAKPAVALKPAVTPRAPPSDETFEPEVISARTRATAAEIARELDRAGSTRDEDMFDEQIVTAGARSFSENRAPASLTIISADEIRLSGAATVPEILRRVPGIDVAEMNPSDTNISFRGFNRRVANKVLVLVDGRPVYQDFLGATLFPLLGVTIQDIGRIEVIRGPGSALYGANAFAGVVNIITKVGEDADGVRAFIQGGGHNTFDGGVAVGGRSGKLAYRTTVSFDRADKWGKDPLASAPGMSSQFSLPDRSREVQRADISGIYELGREDMLRFGAGFQNMSALEIVPLGALRTFGNNGQAGFARAELDMGHTKLKGFWNALRMSSGPEYWPGSTLSIASSVRSDVVDLSTETGFDFKALGTHHLNFGVGYRYKTVDWGYLAVRQNDTNRYEEHHFNGFLQEEWQPRKDLSLILSYRVDRNPILYAQNVTAGGLVHSPRGSLLWEVKPEQVLRLTVGSAFRAPTFLESYIDLFAPIPGASGVGVRFQGDRSLSPEQMVQAELGYRGRIGSFQPEIVLYGERVTHLITDGIVRAPATAAERVDPVSGQMVAAYTGFQNEGGSFLGLGAEIGGRWSPRDGIDIGANYSFEKLIGCPPDSVTSSCTTDQSTPNQVSAYLANTAQHKANLFATWRTKINFDFGVDVHYVSAVTWYEKSFALGAGGAPGVSFDAYKLDPYTMVNGRVGYHFIKDRLEGGVAFYNLLETDETGHQEHPFGNRIGRRVLFTASGTF